MGALCVCSLMRVCIYVCMFINESVNILYVCMCSLMRVCICVYVFISWHSFSFVICIGKERSQ